MSEKIKVTQKQADAIEEYKRCQRSNHYQESVNKQRYNLYLAKCLLDLTSSEFMDALYIGYEVEPVFEVGDWVKSLVGKGTGKIKDIDKYDYYTDFAFVSSKRDLTIRHATPEEIAEEQERRWWNKHGRELREVKKGDLLKRTEDGHLFIINHLPLFYDEVEDLKNGRLKVVCFSESRLDVKTNG